MLKRRNKEGIKERGGHYYDAVEDTAEYKAIKDEVERLVESEIGDGGHLGFCHRYWAVKKRILRERFGIAWRSPAELNPHIRFD